MVEGDDIGVDASGEDAVPNGYEGVFISEASDNTVGGTTAGAHNVISGNGTATNARYPGVELIGAGTSGNLIEGDFIGTDARGVVAIANASSGVAIEDGADDNTVGGTTSGAGNVISGNGTPDALEAGYGFGSGVNLDGSDGGASGNVVEGDLIGTDATGTQPLGNLLDGVHLQDGASGNSIGGTAAGAGNVIAFNDGNGVTIGEDASDDSTGDAVLGNAIYANAGIGIDLGDDGPTANGSGGSGPNLLQDTR